MHTIRFTLQFTNLTRNDVEDLRDLRKFVLEMADDRVRNHFVRLLDAAYLAIECERLAHDCFEGNPGIAANESRLVQ